MQTPLSFTRNFKEIVNVIHTPIHIFLPGKYGDGSEVRINAIWDTGATKTCITCDIVKKLGLVASGGGMMQIANKSVFRNSYLVDVGLPNHYIVPNIRVVDVDTLVGGADALIGMDIITLGDFSISNFNRQTMMSFRMPSIQHIDYTGMQGKR